MRTIGWSRWSVSEAIDDTGPHRLRRSHNQRGDFGELAIVYGRPHSGIVRLVNLPGRQQGSYCLNVLERFASELSQAAILTLSSDRVRIRPAE